jgi:deazaflavin-dependent oxidoreductase (nitroreductase family)
MYSVIVGTTALVVSVFLVVVYYVLKAAHARPAAHGAPRAHGTSRGHSGLEGAVLLILSSALKLLLRLGIGFRPMMLLTVRGRKTGVPRTSLVDMFERNGRYWLVATHSADANWVRNLRAAGAGTLARGRRRLSFTAAELGQEQAGTVLKEVVGPRLARPVAGFVLRQTLGVPADGSLEDFIRAAELHPVFELAVSRAVEAGGVDQTPSSPRRARGPLIAIVVGALLAAGHATLGAIAIMNVGQWVPGVAIGLLLAGVGNHLRIFGRP